MKKNYCSSKASLLVMLITFGLQIKSFAQIAPAGASTATDATNKRRSVTFTASTSNAITLRTNDTLRNIRVSLVGGGGGGGGGSNTVQGGGGGGGQRNDVALISQWILNNNFDANNSITIGSGGTGGVVTPSPAAGSNGSTSTFSTGTTTGTSYSAAGGFGGLSANGASGGNSGNNAFNGGLGTASAGGGVKGSAGGGAGAGSIGGAGISAYGGSGGTGASLAANLSSNTNLYAAGGGGGSQTAGGNGSVAASGGGGSGSRNAQGGAGVANTGGGGGGGEGNPGAGSNPSGGDGGSGVVVVSWDAYDVYTATGTYSSTSWVNTSSISGVRKVFAANGTITISANTTFGTDVVVVESGCTLVVSNATLTCGTIYVFGALSVTGTGSIAASEIVMNNATGGQTIPAGTYSKIDCRNTSGINTAAGNITVTGVVSISNGATLDMSTFVLTNSAGTISNSGTLKTSNTFTTGSTSIGGTVEFAAGGNNIPSKTYQNLTFSNTSGTNTASGAITVTGNLSIASGGILNMSTFALTNSVGTLSNSGTLRTSTTFSTGSSVIGGTVEFAVSGNTIPSKTYNNLTCSNSTGTQTLGGNVIVTGTLTIANGGVLDLNGNNLRGVNAFSGTGTIKGSATSRIYITGSAAGTFYMDQTTDLTTNRLKYLGLAQSATATLGNKLVVYGDTSYSGVVDLRTSSVLTTNTTATDAARLVFKYNITDDRHGNIGYNGGSISGEALVEDYFPAATIRGYRQLGHTLDSAMSLNQLTDDLDLYGVISSGTSGRGNNRDGLIAATSTAKNSIFLYDEKSSTGSKWVPFTTTTTNNVIPFGAGAMYVMRPAGTGEAGSYNAQLIDYEGQVTFGSKSVTCKKLASMTTNGGWNLLSNPYQTCLDFDKFLTTNNTRLNITGFKKYNKETKNYVDHVKSGSAWSKGGISITKPNLHPGDAFWVQVKSDGDIMNFAESMLTNDPTSDVSKGNKLEMDSTLFNTLTMKLSSSQDSTIGDEITLLNASWGKSLNFSAGDMTNVNGTCIDLSVEGGNQEKISFKTLPISTDCIIPFFVAACASGTYTFNFDINYNKPVEAMKYRLLDKFTGKQLDIKAGDNYKFAIDLNDSRSFGSGRFYINCIVNTLDNENINKGTSEYSIYPNPVSKTETLTIARNASSGKIGTASLLNQLGQVIYSKKITNEMGLEVLNLSSLEIQPGIYFLQLEGNNGTEAIKLVIK